MIFPHLQIKAHSVPPLATRAHVAAAIAETASAQMERAAPSMAGAEPLPNTAAVAVVAAHPAQAQVFVLVQ